MGKIAGMLWRLAHAYGQLIGIIVSEAPFMVVLTFVVAVASGLLTPLGVFASRHVFDDGEYARLHRTQAIWYDR